MKRYYKPFIEEEVLEFEEIMQKSNEGEEEEPSDSEDDGDYTFF